jgi:hypothetical protein
MIKVFSLMCLGILLIRMLLLSAGGESEPIPKVEEMGGIEEPIQIEWIIEEPEPLVVEGITFTFIENGEERQVVIGKEDIISMSIEELHNFMVLIDLCKMFWVDFELMKILGEKLLPRFFIEDNQKRIKELE